MKHLLIILIFISSNAHAQEYTHFMIHHTDTPRETKSGEPYPEFNKSLCDKLARDRGWDECGYNFMVNRDGIVYYGRELGKPGAHCPNDNMNRLSVGVALVLKGEEEKPTFDQMEAVFALKRQLDKAFGRELTLTKHGDHKPTLCPGKFVKEALDNAK